jgi:3-methylcrotonyl-CoA carboxylase alpha subunit
MWVTLEGRDAQVEVSAADGRVFLEVDGRRIEADFHRLPDGEVYSLLVDGRSWEVRVAPDVGVLQVTVQGVTLPVAVRHPLEKALQVLERTPDASAGETLAAPMPGVVVAVRVRPGEHVVAGQAVVVIEAMKMQNELTVRHAGVVREVLVQERTTVATGQPLVRLGPEEA